MEKNMPRPTLEQEKAELDAVTKLLFEHQSKLTELHRICNSLTLMKMTIENSIAKRTKEAVPKAEDHKSELNETRKA